MVSLDPDAPEPASRAAYPATLSEVLDILDSRLDAANRHNLLLLGDKKELSDLHFSYCLYIRNEFIHPNPRRLELLADCARIAKQTRQAVPEEPDDLSSFIVRALYARIKRK